MNLFRKPYTIRRYGKQEYVKGHATAAFTETRGVMLDVQTVNPNNMEALAEGFRTSKRIKAFGDFVFQAADQTTGTPGDLLWYSNEWYRCISSVYKEHTILHHCRSDFVSAPSTESGEILKPPKRGGRK